MMGYLDSFGSALGFRRKKTLADKVQDVAERAVETVQDALDSVSPIVAPMLTKSGDFAFKTGDRVRDAYGTTYELVAPVLATRAMAATKKAARAADEASDKLSHGLERASDVAGAAAESTAAAAGAVGGLFAGVFSSLWWLARLSVKMAILGGVAYGGWRWLQSRQHSDVDLGGSTYQPAASYTSTYGNVSPASAGSPVGAAR